LYHLFLSFSGLPHSRETGGKPVAISEKLWPFFVPKNPRVGETHGFYELRWQRARDLAKQHLEERKQMSGDPASQWPNMARKAMNIPYISMDWFKGKLRTIIRNVHCKKMGRSMVSG
jgi:hypothetical protein